MAGPLGFRTNQPTMKAELLARLRPFGQEHLLDFWDGLDEQGRRSLAAQIRAVDFALVDRLYGRRDRADEVLALAARARQPPAIRPGECENRFSPEQARERGAEALAAGRVGVILVAGGQGTRLGFDHPKGMFPIGPVSGNSIFQIHAEKVLATARRYGARVPLGLMVSPATDAETRRFFAQNENFGLAKEDLRIFCQGSMPAVDEASGKVLLADRHRLALSPDGHGGTLPALAASGLLDELAGRGIEQLFYFQVDNPLVDVCSPEFLGYHLLARSELTSQVVAKRDPAERVGNVVLVDGRLRVIEYIDLPPRVARRRRPDGSLEIWAGSIAVHVFDVAFLRRMAAAADALPYHFARKTVPHLDSRGNRVEPQQPNAIKFERFIFDLLPWAENALVVEVDPGEHFAPLKNAPGDARDTPQAVRRQMAAVHRKWLRQAGAKVPEEVPVEISPLYALDAGEVARKIPPGTVVDRPTYFGPDRWD